MTTTLRLEVPGAILTYDVRGPLPSADGRPPLLMVGSPMDAAGFARLASYFGDRTVVTYDPRGLSRSVRHDGRSDHQPARQAADLHALIEALGTGVVDMFASSGGAVVALALVAAHPGDVRILVAHEPPLLALLPDAERAFAAEGAVQKAYAARGLRAGQAGFTALSWWRGEFPDEFTVPDVAAEDDGSRDDPLLSGSCNPISRHLPDFAALTAAPTRILIAAGVESEGVMAQRAAAAVAEALGLPLTMFPSHHRGFLGDDFPQSGRPEAFAARLREVLGTD
jgi:pimeloyl-ACP methyl ester carboxylesterase